MSDEIIINEIKIVCTQGEDSCSNDGMQSLEISKVDAGAGMYYVIKTERWAFDNIEDLINLLNKANIDRVKTQ